ncbi:MAG: GNAT family N-acetyltransferase [Planctomycetota bacterium]
MMKRTPGTCSRPRLQVRDLEPSDWAAVEELFGANGACGGCWCMYWRLERGGKLWEERKGAPNKGAFKKLITAGAVHACLAFAGEEPVGWCCAGPRSDFPRLERSRVLRTDADEHTWSVVCFFIPARWRGRGVATALLEQAVKLAKKRGAHALEGYPVRSTKAPGSRIPAAFAWTGVPSLFEKAGFEDVTPAAGTRPIYRRELRRRTSSSSGRRRSARRGCWHERNASCPLA